MSAIRSAVIPDNSRSAGESSNDPRAARTRQVILDAATRHPTGRNDVLSVTDIVREAGISRSSFYAHFSSLDDLAGALLRREFASIALPLQRIRAIDGSQKTFRESYRRLVAHFSEADSIYSTALGLPLSRQVYDEVIADYAEQVRSSFEAQGHGRGDIRPKISSLYVAGGTVALLGAWIAGDLEISADELVDELVALLPPWLG